MAPNDKRASPRFSAKSGNHVIYIEGSGAIPDLSLNGVFVLDPDPLPVGTHIHLELRLGGHGIPVKGIVQRSVAQEGKLGAVVGEFVDLTMIELDRANDLRRLE